MTELINVRRAAQGKAEDIAVDGASRGFQPVDLFGALAQVICDRNPDLGFQCLNVLERIVKARRAILPDEPVDKKPVNGTALNHRA